MSAATVVRAGSIRTRDTREVHASDLPADLPEHRTKAGKRPARPSWVRLRFDFDERGAVWVEMGCRYAEGPRRSTFDGRALSPEYVTRRLTYWRDGGVAAWPEWLRTFATEHAPWPGWAAPEPPGQDTP